MEVVELPGGSFLMGSPESDGLAFEDEKPQRRVRVSAFAMARLPVTRQLYRQIVGRSAEQWPTGADDDRLPATHIDWFAAIDFCNALSQHAGLRACYRRHGQAVEWEREANGYRLPTEAEWEYAARAGTTTRWFFGDDPKALDRHAWWAENAGGQVHPVGEKEANPWGLHDIIGNTYEWCWDWYAAYPAAATATVADPAGPAAGSLRVLRGGAFWDVPGDLRSAVRDVNGPEDRNYDFGFRCVRGPRRQPP